MSNYQLEMVNLQPIDVICPHCSTNSNDEWTSFVDEETIDYRFNRLEIVQCNKCGHHV